MTPEQRAAEDAQRAQQAKEKAEKEEKDKAIYTAQIMCERVLTQSLNDPDSAKLDDATGWAYQYQKGNKLLIQPTGRAKNAFGAYIYGTWNCFVTVDNDGKPTGISSLKQIRP
jgi:hypothetical protein